MTKPRLGICIPVWNRGTLFKICFESLIRQLEGIEATLWIFDNGSDSETRKIVEDIQSDRQIIRKIFLEQNMGIPYVVNVFCSLVAESCEYTHYEAPGYVMLIDADAYFNKPVVDMIHVLDRHYAIGLISGHDSTEHPTFRTHTVPIDDAGKTLEIKEKPGERMISMIMRKEELVACYPFPHHRNQGVDGDLIVWSPNSMRLRKRIMCVAPDYVYHLGIYDSTWQPSDSHVTDEERKIVDKILRENGVPVPDYS